VIVKQPPRPTDRSSAVGAGAAGRGDIRGVQLAGCGKHAVGVCDDGDKARGADDGAAGTAGGGDMRGVQLANRVSVAGLFLYSFRIQTD
jgi:hypothetical protein